MLSSQEQQVWDDVQRSWAIEADEPPRLAIPAPKGEPGVLEQEELPVAVAAGAWIAIALVLFGVVLAGVAVAVVTSAGWALWRNWPQPSDGREPEQ